MTNTQIKFEQALKKLKGKEFTIKEFQRESGLALTTCYYYLFDKRIKNRKCECGKSKIFKLTN